MQVVGRRFCMYIFSTSLAVSQQRLLCAARPALLVPASLLPSVAAAETNQWQGRILELLNAHWDTQFSWGTAALVETLKKTTDSMDSRGSRRSEEDLYCLLGKAQGLWHQTGEGNGRQGRVVIPRVLICLTGLVRKTHGSS